MADIETQESVKELYDSMDKAHAGDIVAALEYEVVAAALAEIQVGQTRHLL